MYLHGFNSFPMRNPMVDNFDMQAGDDPDACMAVGGVPSYTTEDHRNISNSIYAGHIVRIWKCTHPPKAASAPSSNISVSVPTQTNTQVSPQISPVFTQQEHPTNSPVTANPKQDIAPQVLQPTTSLVMPSAPVSTTPAPTTSSGGNSGSTGPDPLADIINTLKDRWLGNPGNTLPPSSGNGGSSTPTVITTPGGGGSVTVQAPQSAPMLAGMSPLMMLLLGGAAITFFMRGKRGTQRRTYRNTHRSKR